jgi:hypothetical protein
LSVIVASRLRKGSAGSAKGAASLIAEAIKTVRAMGATGMILVRADSAFFSHKVVAACRRAKARFSLAVAQRKKVREAIASIPEDAWTAIKYPKAIWDADEQRWISDAEVAEVEYTAFAGKAKKYRTTARLLVRRVRRLNDVHVPNGQGELFKVWRFHAVFTDSLLELVEAERCHRAHAIVEQVFADLEDSALGHLPSGRFTANAAWLTLAALAHNLTRALGALASAFHARARTGTIRRQLLAVPARLAASAHTLTFTFPSAGPSRTPSKHCGLPLAAACRPDPRAALPAHDQGHRRPRHRDGHPAITHTHQRKPAPEPPRNSHRNPPGGFRLKGH